MKRLVLMRAYRPKRFSEVIGQEAIVTTLKNAIKHQHLSQSYLFSGSRGTGKTTLARLLAKALNCAHLGEDGEPCNQCTSCLEISQGNSMDVLEIDGASNRGIDDIRGLTATVCLAASHGRYKVYIIDEVHMLTTEAFNALLKTLEEPPAHVKFVFATTEPHKVPLTIISRCTRFSLNRISQNEIVKKLKDICTDLKLQASEEALLHISSLAEGGMRDAEALLDQVIAYAASEPIDEKMTHIAFGTTAKEVFFSIDEAVSKQDYLCAFKISDMLFQEGKHLLYFFDGLIEHFRTICLLLETQEFSLCSPLTAKEKDHYQKAIHIYQRVQVLDLFQFLVNAQDTIRFHTNPKSALESIIIHIIKSRNAVSIGCVIEQLKELEEAVKQAKESQVLQTNAPFTVEKKTKPASISPLPEEAKVKEKQQPLVTAVQTEEHPMPKELKKAEVPVIIPTPVTSVLPVIQTPQHVLNPKMDTLLQFAAVELEGTLQRNP